MDSLSILSAIDTKKAVTAPNVSGTKNLDAYKAKAKATAQDFESVFLSTAFQQMFTEMNGDGPVGGGGGSGVWRSFLSDEFAKSFAKNGGVGLSDQVYASLIATQAARQP